MTSVELCVISHPEMKKPLRCSNSIKVHGGLASAQEEAAAARTPGGSESAASAAKEIEKQQKIRACENDSEKNTCWHVPQSRSDCTQWLTVGSARPCGTARARLPPPGPVRGHARLCAQLTLSKIENYLRVVVAAY